MIRLVARPTAITNNFDEVNKIVDRKLTEEFKDQIDLNLNTVLHGKAHTMGTVLTGMKIEIEDVPDNAQEFSLFNTVEQVGVSLLNTRYMRILDDAVNEVNLRHPEYRR